MWMYSEMYFIPVTQSWIFIIVTPSVIFLWKLLHILYFGILSWTENLIERHLFIYRHLFFTVTLEPFNALMQYFRMVVFHSLPTNINQQKFSFIITVINYSLKSIQTETRYFTF